jgi:methyl-accepting chemotaxis protein
VRGLAQRSAQAAKEIRALIERSVGEVDAGYRLANEAGATMRDIVGSVNNVLETVARISTQAQDQSHGLEQVSLAVSELDRMTQQNAALVEQSAAAAAALKDQADRLGHRVAVFKLEQATAVEPPPCATLAEPAGS